MWIGEWHPEKRAGVLQPPRKPIAAKPFRKQSWPNGSTMNLWVPFMEVQMARHELAVGNEVIGQQEKNTPVRVAHHLIESRCAPPRLRFDEVPPERGKARARCMARPPLPWSHARTLGHPHVEVTGLKTLLASESFHTWNDLAPIHDGDEHGQLA